MFEGVNQYVYDAKALWIPHGVAIFAALVTLITGFVAFIKNGWKAYGRDVSLFAPLVPNQAPHELQGMRGEE
jgi:hypothetical protein